MDYGDLLLKLRSWPHDLFYFCHTDKFSCEEEADFAELLFHLVRYIMRRFPAFKFRNQFMDDPLTGPKLQYSDFLYMILSNSREIPITFCGEEIL